jgi:branched-subunit amino acid aminotransferase/4-amino-4-deoxychorismate lyase
MEQSANSSFCQSIHEPTALCLHYGQTVFEGMKAFRMKDGRINIFRIEKHYERFNRSLTRMCMAEYLTRYLKKE